MLRTRIGLGLLLCLGATACGPSLSQRPVKSDAELGRVIVYRSGVAYFERHALVRDGKLTLSVPAERVDDFLKSLTIRELASGRSLPVSYPTLARHGNRVELTIELPKDAAREVSVTYVSESAAWKPSYRVELDSSGKGKLEAWAIVDNVSGEDWDKVTIGVGSTSALSFKYDLHSVRFVERETLNEDPAVALAPPSGGSPYAVANGEVTVVGNIGLDDVDRIGQKAQEQAFLDDVDGSDKEVARHKGMPARPMKKPATGARLRALETKSGNLGGAKPAESEVVALAQSLKTSGQRVRIEGYAKADEADSRGASLARANAVKDALLANGVPAAQVEAVGTGRVSNRDGVRMLALQGDAKPAQAKAPPTAGSAGPSDPIGSALFVSPTPLTLDKDRSALLNMLSVTTRAEQVYYYDPISSRGSRRFAFRAVRLDNPSEHTLDSGPFTVYAKGQFLGEGLSEPIPPKSTAFIPYALDRQVLIEPLVDTREEIDRLVTIQRGIVTTEAQTIRRTKLELSNRGDATAKVYVRHLVPEGWKLREGSVKAEKLRGAYLFPIEVKPRSGVVLEIEETQPLEKTVDLATDAGVETLAIYLEKTKKLEPELAKQLDELIKLHKGMVDTEEHIRTIESQMATYRERIDEIHAQLVTLRRVTQADKLSRHLAQKMEEISDRLQKATIDVTDLKGRLMTDRIALADRLAELSLEKKNKAVAENEK